MTKAAAPAAGSGDDDRRVLRMNYRNQLDEDYGHLALALSKVAQTYAEATDALGLEPDKIVARLLGNAGGLIENALDRTEKQLDRDLMRQQRREQQ